MDRRQRKTRNAIFEAFGNLLSKKSYSKLTVQEIIDEANVGRTTFYDHFETKDELLKEMCADLFDHVFSDTLLAENSHDFSMKMGNTREMITHILYHLLDRKKNIIGILTCESSEAFLIFFRQYLNELIVPRMLSSTELTSAKIPTDFLVNHISSSFVSMVQWWMKNGLSQTPEQLADYYIAMIEPVI